ncbi:MAG: hypothetical protein HYZ72_12640 [Deltaproteobacteria bacterium]|nr:hypothetical protein [Deltaproteobacteria bacterium]
MGNAPGGELNASGDGTTSPGAVTLQGCTGVAYNGTVMPAVTILPNGCSGEPNLPSYVDLPTCECAGISVTKTCSADLTDGGTKITVTFEGEVENTGKVQLNNVKISDEPAATFTTSPPSSLAPGQKVPYTGNFKTTTNPSSDTVTVEGDGAFNSGHVKAMADATCSVTPNPSLTVTKMCTDASAFGQPIKFNGKVCNTGNVELTGVMVSDAPPPSGSITLSKTTLAPKNGAVIDCATYSGSYTPKPKCMTLAHWHLRLPTKSPHPPFDKGGRAQRGGICRSSSSVRILWSPI